MPLKKKQFDWLPNIPLLRAASQSCLGILLINWVAQGTRGMDRGELVFRALLEVLLALVFAVVLRLTSDGPPVLDGLAGLVLAHTVNWTLNGHVWVCFRYCPGYRADPDLLNAKGRAVIAKVEAARRVQEALVIGSFADHGLRLRERSDMDLRLIRPPGLAGWFHANLLLLHLRAWAFLRGFPLDLYAYGDLRFLQRFRTNETWLIIKDAEGRLADMRARTIAYGSSSS
ncbi:hypothetical protein [Arenibaculum sp.]|jgi:hypothetical protein|uniref:hypothetical protein n=1 Tax=Arenibaculum sp. TaxID=2865862 RepID=UPI002E0D703B|nr:hypothetical protein [Arenibaculum sp.]